MDARIAGGAPARAGILSPGRLAVFAMAGLPVGGYVATLAVFLPNYYARRLGLNLIEVGVAFTVVRILDILLDPALGVIMDQNTSRFGRYRPWLAASIPVLVLATWATYFAQKGDGAIYLTAWLLVLYVGYSMCVLSHAAWGTALVAEYHARSRVYGWIQAVGVIGALGVLLVPGFVPLFVHHAVEPVPVMGWFFVITVPLTFAITAFFAPEPPDAPVSQAKHFALRDYLALVGRPDMGRTLAATLLTTFGPAITAPLYLFFFEDARGYTPGQANYLLIIYILAGLLAPAFWSRVALRAGKHQTIKISAGVYAIAQTALLLVPRAHFWPMAVAMFSVGFIASAFGFLLRAMIADICDEVRLETGKDCTALLYALSTGSGKFATTVSVGVAYIVLSLFGFNATQGAVNTDTAMWGLQACYLIPPVACVLLGGLAMFGYTLDEKRHGEIRSALHIKEQASAPSSAIESLTGPIEGAVQPGE